MTACAANILKLPNLLGHPVPLTRNAHVGMHFAADTHTDPVSTSCARGYDKPIECRASRAVSGQEFCNWVFDGCFQGDFFQGSLLLSNSLSRVYCRCPCFYLRLVPLTSGFQTLFLFSANNIQHVSHAYIVHTLYVHVKDFDLSIFKRHSWMGKKRKLRN